MNDDVTVVVPARNAARWLNGCLLGIRANRPGRLIVVDGASTDATVEIARKHADLVLDDGGRGVAAARNLGVQAARTKWVLLVDADVVLGPGVITRLVDEADARGLEGLQAGLHSVGDGDYWSEQLAQHHNRGHVRHWFGVSVTLLLRSTLLSHPLDPDFSTGEDIDLRVRLRAASVRVGVSESVVAVHRFAAGRRFATDQWTSDGAGLGRLVRRHGLRVIPSALLPLPAAVYGTVMSWRSGFRAAPYFAGFAAGNWLGLLRGLGDRRVRGPHDGIARLLQLVVLLSPLLVPAAAAGLGLAGAATVRAAYEGDAWTQALAGASLVLVVAAELARAPGGEAHSPARLLARFAAIGLGLFGLATGVARLLGIILT